MTMQHALRPGSAAINGVYDRLKARVIDHHFPAGKRIPIDDLAKEFIVSATPIREALIRLSCERLIDEVPKAGFFAKEISEQEIGDLYELQLALLERSLRTIGQIEKTPGVLKPPNLGDEITRGKEVRPETVAKVMNELFIHISKQSGKTNYIYLVCNINDRTYFVHKKDYEIFGDPDEMLVGLCRTYYKKDFEKLRADLGAFFCRKLDRLPDFFRLLRAAYLRDSA